MSTTMWIFGLMFMKAFFRMLYREARASGGPIVFMTHVEELDAERPELPRQRFRWRDVLSSRYGFPFRHALKRTEPKALARDSVALLEYMRSFAGVQFVTVPDYVRRLNRW